MDDIWEAAKAGDVGEVERLVWGRTRAYSTRRVARA
jgi:hypothetical protein